MTVVAIPETSEVRTSGGTVCITTSSGSVYLFSPAKDGGWWYTRQPAKGAIDLVGPRPTTWIAEPPALVHGRMVLDGIISTRVMDIRVLP